MDYHVEESNLAITGLPTALKEIWGKGHSRTMLESIAKSVLFLLRSQLDGGYLRKYGCKTAGALPKGLSLRGHCRTVWTPSTLHSWNSPADASIHCKLPAHLKRSRLALTDLCVEGPVAVSRSLHRPSHSPHSPHKLPGTLSLPLSGIAHGDGPPLNRGWRRSKHCQSLLTSSNTSPTALRPIAQCCWTTMMSYGKLTSMTISSPCPVSMNETPSWIATLQSAARQFQASIEESKVNETPVNDE